VSLGERFLESAAARFRTIRSDGERAMAQLSSAADFHARRSPDANSIAVLVRHLSGNMISRWTRFLDTDGEKPERDRDGEFEPREELAPEELLRSWNEGWERLFEGLAEVAPGDLLREVTIRGQSLTVVDAILRQLAHAAGHVGQIVLLARDRAGEGWKTLSIPRGQSRTFVPPGR